MYSLLLVTHYLIFPCCRNKKTNVYIPYLHVLQPIKFEIDYKFPINILFIFVVLHHFQEAEVKIVFHSYFVGRSQFQYPDEHCRKPAVPKHTDKPAIMGIRSNKNFITTNAVENIMSVPKKPEKKYADTKVGATHQLDPSGLTPKYRNKKDFGKNPEYLEKRKKEMETAQIEYDAYIRERFRQGAMQQISEDER